MDWSVVKDYRVLLMALQQLMQSCGFLVPISYVPLYAVSLGLSPQVCCMKQIEYIPLHIAHQSYVDWSLLPLNVQLEWPLWTYYHRTGG